MRIAIVTPTYNRKEKTLRFLEYLDKQSFKAFEVYIVDSGSVDGTLVSIREKELGYVVHTLTVGSDKFWSGATNAGVQKALADGAEYIVTLNDDAIIPDFYFERMIGLIEKYDLKILTSRIDIWKGSGRIWLLGADFNWGSSAVFCSKNFNMQSYDLPIIFSDFDVVEVQAGCGNGTFIKSDVYREIGLYNEEFCPHYHGDSEFLLRAKARGISIFSTTKVRLFNDMSDFVPVYLRRFKDIFLGIGSPYYFRAVLYVVSEYAPKNLILKTLILYYLKILAIYFLKEKGVRSIKSIYLKFGVLSIFKKLLYIFIRASRLMLSRIERAVF